MLLPCEAKALIAAFDIEETLADETEREALSERNPTLLMAYYAVWWTAQGRGRSNRK